MVVMLVPFEAVERRFTANLPPYALGVVRRVAMLSDASGDDGGFACRRPYDAGISPE
jgi:hypothetical protein